MTAQMFGPRKKEAGSSGARVEPPADATGGAPPSVTARTTIRDECRMCQRLPPLYGVPTPPHHGAAVPAGYCPACWNRRGRAIPHTGKVVPP